jgi:hypothetical protein
MRLLRTAPVLPSNNDELHHASHRRTVGGQPLRSSSSSLLSWPQFSLLLPLLLLTTRLSLLTLLSTPAVAFTTTTTPFATRTTRVLHQPQLAPLKSFQWTSSSSSSPRICQNMVSMSEVEAPGQSYSGDSGDGPPAEVPELGSDGVYHLMTGEEHK